MTDQENESFAEWLFHARKLKRRTKRHTTHTTTEKKETEK